MTNMIADEAVAKSSVLSVFDFDGTLTHHDSFIPFLRFAFGKRYFAGRLVRMALPTLHCVRRKLTRDELKEVLIKTFLTGVDEHWLRQQAEAFCEKYWNKLMRGRCAGRRQRGQFRCGSDDLLCFPALVLQPWADKLGIKLIGTQLEVKDGKLTRADHRPQLPVCPEGGEAGEGVWGFERVSPARTGRHAWRPRVAGGGAGSTLAAFSSSEQAPKFTN